MQNEETRKFKTDAAFARLHNACEPGPEYDDEDMLVRQGDVRTILSEVLWLRENVIAFCAVWATTHAIGRGLPSGHLYPEHYDILARAGARMDGFVRAEIGKP